MGRWADRVAMGLTGMEIKLRNASENARRLRRMPAQDLLGASGTRLFLRELRAIHDALKNVVQGVNPRNRLTEAIKQMQYIQSNLGKMNGHELAIHLDLARQSVNATNKLLIEYAPYNRSMKTALYSPDHIKGLDDAGRTFWARTFAVASTACGQELAAKIADSAVRGRIRRPHKDGRSAPTSVPKGNRLKWAQVYNAAYGRTRDKAMATRIADGVVGKMIRSKSVQPTFDEMEAKVLALAEQALAERPEA